MPSPNVPNKETVDFPHSAVIVDKFLTEPSSSYVGTYNPIEPGQPYVPLNHSVAQAAQYAGLISLGQNAGKDREFQERFWASDPVTQDIYNYSIEPYANNNLLPLFKRRYLIKRDEYPSKIGVNLSPLTGLYAIEVINPGGGYDPANPPAVTCNGGATAIAIVDPVGLFISKITLKNEGQNCTSTVTIAPPGGFFTQATALGILQPANCLLIDEEAVPAPEPWGSLYLQVDRTYETLPGDILVDIVPDAELGIPNMTTTQRRAATDSWPCGEFAPIAFNISSASIATQTVVQLATAHDFVIGEYVVGLGTANTTPTMNGTFLVVDIPTPTSVTLALHITGISGTIGGTLKRYSYMSVERRKTDNSNVVLKITTRAITNDITAYTPLNKSVCSRPYPFPDALIEIFGYDSTTSGQNLTSTEYGYSYSFSGGIGFKILNGYRGDCVATRIRIFSMGPFSVMPTDPQTGQPYAPTVVIPASGTVTVAGGADALTLLTTGMTTSHSNTWKGERIPPVLTSAFSGAITPVGSGRASFSIDLPDSIIKDPGSSARAGFVQGDIITTIDPPEKLRGISVWMLTVWKIVVPYTTGVGPA